MTKAPAFALNVKDWMCSRSVATMTGDQVKAYMYLLCEAWLQEPRATLPTDDIELSEMARMNLDKWQENKSAILRCFKSWQCDKHTKRYYSERLLEVSKVSEIRALNRKNKTKSKLKQTETKQPTSREKRDNINTSLFDFWVSQKSLIRHKTKTAGMVKAESRWLKEYDEHDLLQSIKNYAEIMSAPNGAYFGQYAHTFDDFFRAGAQKSPPFQKFLPECNPLVTLRKNTGKKNNEKNDARPVWKRNKNQY